MIRQARFCILVVLLMAPAAGRAAETKPAAGKPDDSARRDKIARYIRERFGLPAAVKLTVSPLRSSFDPNLLEATVSVDDGKQTKDTHVLVSKDGRHLVVGDIYDMGADPRQTALRAISTRNQPSQGPANAPVTIVEYADLQCPMCARLHEFFEKELLPKYPGQVRIVYKDFPLVAIHDWTQMASLASQCAYQLDPANFVAYRSLIFRNQTGISPTNSRDMLLNLASQAGIDSLRLAACVDSQASRPRLEDNLEEGKKVGVQSTPTCYVNGKIVVGFTSPDDYYKAIDEALRAGK